MNYIQKIIVRAVLEIALTLALGESQSELVNLCIELMDRTVLHSDTTINTCMSYIRVVISTHQPNRS